MAEDPSHTAGPLAVATAEPAVAPPASPPGYELCEEIGHGGMGVVYRALDTALDRHVAIKLLAERYPIDSSGAQRFLIEARITGQLQHPGIPAVHQVGTLADGRPFLAMKLIKGSTFEAILRRPTDPAAERGRLLAIFEAVCQAVGYAHAHRVIHRDLKPANVMVGAFGEVQVMDWGLAKVLGEERPADLPLGAEQTQVWTRISSTPDSSSNTAAGSMVGTPAYMPPEQAVGQIERVNARSDVFGLGALLAVVLTGKPPYVGETHDSVRVMAVRGTLEDCFARLDASGAEPELVALCKRCLAFEPADRPADAGAVAQAVADLRAEADERARCAELERVRIEGEQATALARAAERRKRRRLVLGAAALLALAAISGMSAVLAVQRRANSDLADKNTALAAEHARATHAQKVAQAERQQAVTNLYHARVEEAGALRRARSMGYRGQVFNLLREALQLDTPDKDSDRLRQEAVNCLGDFVGLEPITWEDFPSTIRDIALTPDGENLAVALDNDTIELRSVRTGGVAARMAESAIGLGIDAEKRWLITIGPKGTIKAWPDLGMKAAPAVHASEMGANLAGMSNNGRFATVYSARKEGSALALWDVARHEVKAQLEVPSELFLGGFQVSDDGRRVAQCVRGEQKLHALVWDLPAAAPKKVFFANTSQNTRALTISPDGRFLACFHGDDGLVLLDLQESLPRPLLRSDSVLGAGFSGDGRLLVYRTITGVIKLWSVSRHQEVATLYHPGDVGTADSSLVSFSTDGGTFATAGARSIRIWKLSGSGEKPPLSGHEGGVTSVAFGPGGKMLASGSKDRLVKLWDAETGRLLRTLPPFETPIQSVAFSPDGRLLATGQFPPKLQPVRVWDVATLKETAPPDDELGGFAMAVAFSPDGKTLAACGQGLTVWRVANDEKGAGATSVPSFRRVVHLPGQRSLYIRISPDGKLLAWVDDAFLVCLWDLENNREIPFPGPPLMLGWHNLAFYPDSDHVTFVTGKGMVETWDARAARRVSSFGREGHYIAASPDGRWLTTVKDSSTVNLWSSRSGSPAFTLPQESGPIWSLAWSPDGERLGVGLADGGLEIWNVPGIQAELGRIGLAWHPGTGPPREQEPQPSQPATPLERVARITNYYNLAKRLASVGRVQDADEANREGLKTLDDSDMSLNMAQVLLLRTAALQAWLARDKELAATRERALKIGQQTKDPTFAERVSKICNLSPSDARTHAAALRSPGARSSWGPVIPTWPTSRWPWALPNTATAITRRRTLRFAPQRSSEATTIESLSRRRCTVR